jgi:hypothetical protein
VAAACALTWLVTEGVAQVPSKPGDWPQWRGPNRDGISLDTGLLKEWPSDGPPVLWQENSVGIGYSSISVKDGPSRMYLRDQESLTAYDLTAK